MEIVVISLLLLLNGFFAMYEIALVSASKPRLETLSAKGNKKADSVLRLLVEPEKILSTIQVGITLIGIVAGAYGGATLAYDLLPYIQNIPMLAEYAEKISFLTVVAIITYFSLIVGELVPKSIALNNPERITMIFTPVMKYFIAITYPFVWLLSISTRIANKILGIRTHDERAITEDELKFLLKQSSEKGIIDRNETQIIRDVFRFTDKKANELMTHRRDVAFILKSATKQELIKIISGEHYSKYLLCDTDIEEIIGVVMVKDIITLFDENNIKSLEDIAMQPVYIPENILANRILEIFKHKKTNFGIVISEYGALEGIITLHDLTEAILGDLPEEDDEPKNEFVKRLDGSILVDGSMNIEDFLDRMNMIQTGDLDDAGFNTLGGLAMHLLDKIPTEGDIFYYRNLKFEIVDMDRSRVDKVLVSKAEEK
jgi:putative hemolysin